MSSTFLRKPDFRLHLGYPEVTLLRSDVPGMVRLAPPDHPAFPDDLRRLAAAVEAADGRLTVILPDREVWRDRLRLSARTPWTRRRQARDLAARALAIPAGEVMLSMGRRGADGSTPLAATRRQTLVEVRRMLAAVGLRAQVIRGAGRFDGFSAPPALGSLRWSPAGRRLSEGSPDARPRAAMAIGGLAAAVAAVALILGAERPAPVTSPGPLVHRSVAREHTALAEASLAPPIAKPPHAGNVGRAAPPPVRPEIAAAASPVHPVTTQPFSMNTRNLDLTTDKDGQVVLKLRNLPGARSLGLETSPAPMPRPRAAREAVATTPAAPLAAPDSLNAQGPRPRPEGSKAAPVAELVRRVAAADTEDFARPEHRPGPGVRVASLTPADAIVGGALTAAAVAPLARPDGFGEAGPAPKPLPVRKTVTETPAAAAPRLQRAATAGAVAARPVATATIVPVRAPTLTVAAPQPKIVPITSTPKIARTARAASEAKVVAVSAASRSPAKGFARTAPQVGLSRGQLSLIGVFGDTDKPHALVRLPNGDIERVRTGDSIAGLQVASVTSDGVRMRSGGSETMLRLPD